MKSQLQTTGQSLVPPKGEKASICVFDDGCIVVGDCFHL